MRLYRLGDSGEPVRDIQARLAGLGHTCPNDPPGEFGEGTRQAVLAFQEERGLDQDGIVGPDTWRALYEAGYRLGDRLLFLRRPMLRGEDVAELQSRLNGLGFDAGKVDGIFGPDTERGIRDFQHNRHLAEDGKVGPEVVTELHLVTRATIRTGRDTIRELEWWRSRPAQVVGTRVYLDPMCRTETETALTWRMVTAIALGLQERGAIPLLSRSGDVAVPERIRARRANRLGAEMVISVGRAEGEGRVNYFQSGHGRSEVGATLAALLGASLNLTVSGKATPILKETRAPAVVILHPEPDEALAETVLSALETFLTSPTQAC